MGNLNCKEEVEENEKFIEGDIIVKKRIELENNLELLFYEKNNSKFLYIKSFMINENTEYIKKKIEIYKKENFSCKILKYKFNGSDNYCRNLFNLEILFKLKQNNLKKEVKKRNSKNEKKYFKEEILWKIIKNMIYYLNNLHENNKFDGDLQLKYIFYNKLPKIKIFNLSKWLINSFGFELMSSNLDKYFTPVSPELLLKIKFKINNSNVNLKNNDIFSLGIILLSITSLKLEKEFYNIKELEIDNLIIQNTIEEIINLNLYSRNLIWLIENCLKINPNNRINLDQIIDFISKHN